MPLSLTSMRRARPLLGIVEMTVGAPAAEMEVAVEAAFAAGVTVHKLMSFHDQASDVGRLNRNAFDPPVAMHRWTFDLLSSGQPAASAVIDPRTGVPVHGIIGATIRVPARVVADALTNVVMATGEGAGYLLVSYGARALFVSAPGGVHVTADWQDGVYLAA